VLGRGPGTAWLALSPRTGRTHQLRVHCAASGFPILGDALYGTASPAGLQLLARGVTVPGWEGREAVTVEAPVPAHMRRALEACGWRP
jgi:tRNA pseudouridine32 synthase/23S rRNA pseudouridine746 synthase